MCRCWAFDDVLDRGGVPATPASRSDASCIQGVCDVPQRVCPGPLSIPDERQHVRGVPVGVCLDDDLSGCTGLGELRTAQDLALRLLDRERGFGAPGDQVALLLAESGTMNGTL